MQRTTSACKKKRWDRKCNWNICICSLKIINSRKQQNWHALRKHFGASKTYSKHTGLIYVCCRCSRRNFDQNKLRSTENEAKLRKANERKKVPGEIWTGCVKNLSALLQGPHNTVRSRSHREHSRCLWTVEFVAAQEWSVGAQKQRLGWERGEGLVSRAGNDKFELSKPVRKKKTRVVEPGVERTTPTGQSVVFRFVLAQMKSKNLHTCNDFDRKYFRATAKFLRSISVTAWNPKQTVSLLFIFPFDCCSNPKYKVFSFFGVQIRNLRFFTTPLPPSRAPALPYPSYNELL